MEIGYSSILNSIGITVKISDIEKRHQLEIFGSLYRDLGFSEAISKQARDEIAAHWATIQGGK